MEKFIRNNFKKKLKLLSYLIFSKYDESINYTIQLNILLFNCYFSNEFN